MKKGGRDLILPFFYSILLFKMNDPKIVELAKEHIKRNKDSYMSSLLSELIDEDMLTIEIVNEELSIARYDGKIEAKEMNNFLKKLN